VLIVVGLALLVLGAHWLVEAAVAIARALGVGELVIGLTIVAAGTSLPEVATSIVAALRGERDIAVGNVVGSNLFNLMAVLGLTALVSPAGVAASLPARHVDMPVMILVAAACLPVVASDHRIERWEGALLLLGYALYLVYLVLGARQHPALDAYARAVAGLVVPLMFVAFALPLLLDRLDRRTKPGTRP
jgi:cation:H+ antiporter